MPDAPLPIGRPSWRRELTEILLLALPLAAAQLAQMLMGVTDAIMMGRVSSAALAAGGLGGNVAFMMIVVSQGLIQGIQPILAQARGAGDAGSYGQTLAGGFIAAALAARPIVLVLTHIDRVLIAAGEPPAIARLTLTYELAFAWGVPASLWQAALRNYLSAFERTRIIMIVSAVACAANFSLNWILIFGHFGVPALGLAGSGYATSIVWWSMAAALTVYTWRAGLVPANLFRLTMTELRLGFGAVWHVGWPMAGIWAVEVWFFAGVSLLMGRFGAVALAANQICMNLCALTFMVPLSIGIAATVRVGFHTGAGALRHARMAGYAALMLGVGFMSCSAVTIRLLAQPIFGLYLDAADPTLPAVAALGTSLLALAALFQVFDGAQAVASGALRGLKDTRAALIAASFGYWGLGMPIGCGLAYGFGLGPVGLWWGFVSGLAVVATLLSLRFHHRVGRMIDAPPLPEFA